MFTKNANISASASSPAEDDASSVTSVTSGSSTASSSWDSSTSASHHDNEQHITTTDAATDAPAYLSTPLVEPVSGYKKVLVTGGAGFIGSHVADHLLSRGDDVVIVDEMNDYYDVRIKESNLAGLVEKYGPDRVAVCRGDICDEEFMINIFETHRPQWVCHMAARAGVRPSIQDPFVYLHSNIKGTTQLMELSHRYGIKNFVFASSSSVYGGSKSTFFSEEENVDNPVSPYAATKKACELLAYTYHHLYRLNVTGLRFFTVYGPRGRPDMAPFKFIDRVSRGVELQKFGDGTSSRDYTYIDDIVDGVVRSLDRPYPYQVFNLGKGSGTSLNEFIAIVEKHVGKKASIRQLPDQPGDVPYTCADVNKARRLLGYRASVSFDEGIRRTCKWYQGAFDGGEGDAAICPETQANGLGRAASCVELPAAAAAAAATECK
jgi:UDP-glucuronate 4-epimerase